LTIKLYYVHGEIGTDRRKNRTERWERRKEKAESKIKKRKILSKNTRKIERDKGKKKMAKK
jgi:hypothetical protein